MTADQLLAEFEAFRPAASRIAGNILRNAADVEDCLQNAAVLVWRNAHHFRGDSRPTTWFHSIVRNMAFDGLRKQRTGRYRRTCQLTEAVEIAAPEHAEASLLDEERRQLVYRSIGLLNPLMRQGLLEHYFTDPADRTRNRSTLKSHARRALIVLRTMKAIQAAA